MTDETKEIFDAPWTIYGEPDDYSFVLQNASEDEIATIFMTDDAKRIARLPELYDAFVEAVYYRCFDCMGGFRHDIGFTSEDLLNDGCPKKSNNCFFLKTLDLLRKVRDGE